MLPDNFLHEVIHKRSKFSCLFLCATCDSTGFKVKFQHLPATLMLQGYNQCLVAIKQSELAASTLNVAIELMESACVEQMLKHRIEDESV